MSTEATSKPVIIHTHRRVLDSNKFFYLVDAFVHKVNVEKRQGFIPAEFNGGAEALFSKVAESRKELNSESIQPRTVFERIAIFEQIAILEKDFNLPRLVLADGDFHVDMEGHISAIQSELARINYRPKDDKERGTLSDKISQASRKVREDLTLYPENLAQPLGKLKATHS